MLDIIHTCRQIQVDLFKWSGTVGSHFLNVNIYAIKWGSSQTDRCSYLKRSHCEVFTQSLLCSVSESRKFQERRPIQSSTKLKPAMLLHPHTDLVSEPLQCLCMWLNLSQSLRSKGGWFHGPRCEAEAGKQHELVWGRIQIWVVAVRERLRWSAGYLCLAIGLKRQISIKRETKRKQINHQSLCSMTILRPNYSGGCTADAIRDTGKRPWRACLQGWQCWSLGLHAPEPSSDPQICQAPPPPCSNCRRFEVLGAHPQSATHKAKHSFCVSTV